MDKITLKDKFNVVTSNNDIVIRARLEEARENLINCVEYQTVKKLESELKAFEENRDKLMSDIISDMKNKKITEITHSGFNFKIATRKSESCKIIDEKLIPKKYMRIKIEPDKATMLKELKQGIYIEGVELEEKNNEKLEIKHTF